ncbi:MAG: nucleotidyltransferase domain-containing protein [Rhodothermales bacterium]
MTPPIQTAADANPTLEQLKAKAFPVLSAYGIRRAGFIGSRARGDHAPDSDLDIMVEFPHDGKYSLFDLIELQDALEKAVGLSVHVVEYDNPNKQFLARALPDEVAIF